MARPSEDIEYDASVLKGEEPSNANIDIGYRHREEQVRPFDVDIRWIGATLAKNGMIEESGVSAAIMGHPAAGVAWSANKLAEQGEFLKKGQFILGGSFTRPVDIASGDVIQADYGPLGAIGVSIA